MNEDKVLTILLDHGELLQKIDKKLERLDLFDELLASQDKMIGLLENIQTEVVATNHALKRHEISIENHEERIERVEMRFTLNRQVSDR